MLIDGLINGFRFLLVLGILILVHELGHFLAARRAGVLVEEFGFGLPPRIWGKKIGETIYSINLLPFGGFVKLHGENTEEGLSYPNRAFVNKSKKTRIGITIAGVVMNFILAVSAFVFVYTFFGIPQEVESGQVNVLEITKDSPAQEAGLMPQDTIKTINNKEVSTSGEFISEIDLLRGEEIALGVDRGGAETILSAKLRDVPASEGALGVTITSQKIVHYFPPIWQRPFVGMYYGFREALFWSQTILVALGGIFKNLLLGEVPRDLAGPVGVFVITSQAAEEGIDVLINFVGLFSVNLALFNLLPLPALDGGRIFFIAVESIIGKKVVPKVEGIIHTVGLVILLFIMLLISVREVNILRKVGFSGFIDAVLK